jgi:hypothetical protein
MTIRGPKRRTEAKIKLRKKEVINSKEQAVVTASRYKALETDSHILQNENRMKTVYGKKTRVINSDQKEKINYTGQNF